MPAHVHTFRIQSGHGDPATVTLKCATCDKPIQYTASDWARMVNDGTVDATLAKVV